MQRDDIIRLRHMLDAAKAAVSFIKGKDRVSLDKDQQLIFALEKAVEIIGEAAIKLSKECRDELHQIPWAKIISMRNRLIHAYFDINLDILWKTAVEDAPMLIAELEKIIPQE
jgi:uncharacterized protein with HEPN domain